MSEVPPLILAHTWKDNKDITGWWISEKLDGLRAYWDGEVMWSRNGNLYYAPDWFTANFPKEPLDGELWIARKSFQLTVSVVRKRYPHIGWSNVIYRVFDAPNQHIPFEQRQIFLNSIIQTKYIHIVEQTMCKGVSHLKEELNKVEALGGEGLMLRQPRSFYEVGRSHTLLKVKSFKEAKAVVIDYEEGKGKHKGRLGALIVREVGEINKVFKVGTGLTDKERNNPPSIGSIIRFRYQELSSGGVPRFPSFIGD